MEAENFDVEIPESCLNCYGHNLVLGIRPKANMARVVCLDCGVEWDLMHLKNKKKRANTPLGHWAYQVKKRDGFICKVCGSENDVQAHHIVPVSIDEKLMYRVSNGITLCKACHKKAHGGISGGEGHD